MNENQALIFIPDISGFTRFVTETEIQHSQHIIEELLEVILESNQIDMSVSEIEGDAILFYRKGTSPGPVEIGAQTKKMFLNFHNFLRRIESETVCQCGACRSASNLSLKFVLHYGEISLSKIREHTKLMGKSIILAHRLLKNNVQSNEYLLLTRDYIDQHGNKIVDTDLDWSDVKEGSITYDHIGMVEYKYINLSPLRKLIKEPGHTENAAQYPNPIEKNVHINAPIRHIYNIIIDLEKRVHWSEGLKKITYDKSEIPRIGSKHLCELATGLVELETVQNSFREGKIEYVERATKSLMFPQATTFFILHDQEEGTRVTIQFHYKKLFIIGWLVDLFFRKKLETNFSKSCQNLKKYCEEDFGKPKNIENQ